MLNSICRILLVLTLSTTLAACGFHLRGKITVPEGLQRIHIKGEDTELISQLGKALEFSDIEIVDSEEGVAVIDLTGTEYDKEVNGTDDSGIATSYDLDYDVKYEVFDKDETSLQKQSMKQDRSLAYDPSKILIFEREERFLKEEMQKELVTQILRRLSKLK